MRAPFTQLYLHLVWATWDRLPLITSEVEVRLYAAIAAKCRELKCYPLAIGGVADHVHLLARLHATVAVATLAKEVKGSTSHLVTHEITPTQPFKWQGAYGAFTLRKEDVPLVKAYIEMQRHHHAGGTSLLAEWELTAILEDGLGNSDAPRRLKPPAGVLLAGSQMLLAPGEAGLQRDIRCRSPLQSPGGESHPPLRSIQHPTPPPTAGERASAPTPAWPAATLGGKR